jgi:tRNA pseudouridine55 synthase
MITKETADLNNADFRSGEVILIDKPYRWSSFKVIHELRKITGEKKIGHAGTLDPLATGLLIICSGKKTKEISNYQGQEKTYKGIILLGKTSPSMDTETEVTDIGIQEAITDAHILSVRDTFLGNILQTPPMYSAIKKNGKNLYLLARKGKIVEREAREINISRFDITRISLPEILFEITCSKGTYIRVIANDFGAKLGTGGILKELRRTRIGTFSVEEALTPQEIREKWTYHKEIPQ